MLGEYELAGGGGKGMKGVGAITRVNIHHQLNEHYISAGIHI